jgi:hypothetical protein
LEFQSMRENSMNRSIYFAAVVVALAFSAPALAENTPPPAATTAPAATTPAPAAAGAPMKLGKACKTDIQTLCAGIDNKGGARARCLRSNEAKLSSDCAKAVAAKPAKWGRPKAAAAPAATAPKPAAAVAAPAADKK